MYKFINFEFGFGWVNAGKKMEGLKIENANLLWKIIKIFKKLLDCQFNYLSNVKCQMSNDKYLNIKFDI